MQPHQERLVAEHKENAERLERLRTFINSETFKTVVPDEQKRLYRQCGLMIELEKVHAERIAAFDDEPVAEQPVIEDDIAGTKEPGAEEFDL